MKIVALLVLEIWHTDLFESSLMRKCFRAITYVNKFKRQQSMSVFNTTSSMLCMQVVQLPRQLDMRFFSTCYYTQPEVDILTRRNRLVVKCYSFLGHEYSFFYAIVSCLIAFKILKSQNFWLQKAHQGSAICFQKTGIG